MALIHDIPASQGVANGIKRAKRLVNARFTPVKRFPIVIPTSYADGSSAYQETFTSPWFPRTGMPYSSVRWVEKYIGYNVSFETFYTALTNPDSVVYTRPITGKKQNVHNHYGVVCSCFVSEVLDFPYRTPCIRFPEVPGMELVPSEPLESLRLLDVLLNVKQHVAIITDIERDEQGKVRFITVSESVMPYCRATRFTTEEFRKNWYEHNYCIYRYAKVDEIRYEPDPFLPIEEDGPMPEPKINRVLMPDYGNKANYRLSEDVLISVFEEGFDRLAVTGPDGTVSTFPVSDGRCTLHPGKPGFYAVRALRGDAESDPVEFCVTDLLFTTDKESYEPGETIRVRFSNSAGDPVIAWQFNRTDTERGAGGSFFRGTLPTCETELICPDRDAPVELYLMAQNAYGIYTSERIIIKKS